jgi:hypothetical protein
MSRRPAEHEKPGKLPVRRLTLASRNDYDRKWKKSAGELSLEFVAPSRSDVGRCGRGCGSSLTPPKKVIRMNAPRVHILLSFLIVCGWPAGAPWGAPSALGAQELPQMTAETGPDG